MRLARWTAAAHRRVSRHIRRIKPRPTRPLAPRLGSGAFHRQAGGLPLLGATLHIVDTRRALLREEARRHIAALPRMTDKEYVAISRDFLVARAQLAQWN